MKQRRKPQRLSAGTIKEAQKPFPKAPPDASRRPGQFTGSASNGAEKVRELRSELQSDAYKQALAEGMSRREFLANGGDMYSQAYHDAMAAGTSVEDFISAQQAEDAKRKQEAQAEAIKGLPYLNGAAASMESGM